jgi:hypothetical protein
MIDRARVYVHQTNALIMFVCLFYFCHIHNQFDHHLHTYTREINFCFIFSDYNRPLRNNCIVMIQEKKKKRWLCCLWFNNDCTKHVAHYWHKLIGVVVDIDICSKIITIHMWNNTRVYKTRYKRAKFFSSFSFAFYC